MTRIEHRPDHDLLCVEGEVDMASVPLLDKALHDAFTSEDSTGLLVVDLTDVGFLGSVGLRSLVIAREHAAETGRRLVVITPESSAVRRAINITGLDQTLVLAADLQEVCRP
ncbi:STAS domain-containing protein [Actinokineospora auranticolor]|uniref:Anti-sigma factor antagonist n=1 Tax=Actinokineospora auranticolor TaxID=155976 RepID=A0A2S6GDS1_9PSEU|nr:STAS domain-containing protein [Actinokineospora auranticolor]PPK63382.1 stage II sporulation protein AA (anti-sigma F factor antagonist) [Actinokineospora auranticolor]